MIDATFPENWAAKRLKYLATYNDEVLAESTDEETEIDYVEISGVSLSRGIEQIERIPFGQAPSRARRTVRSGDILISTVRTYLRAIAKVGKASPDLVASTGFCVVRPERKKVDSGFLGWAAKSEPFVSEVVSRSVGVSYPAINASELVTIEMPLPPLETQHLIAQFLDEKTTRIDNLIEKKRALLERLAEKRQALITQAVTKGLNPDALMRPSGIDWLSEIPAHWNVIALNKVTTKITNGYVGPTRDIFHSEGVRYIQSLHIKSNRIIFKDDFFVDENWSNKHSKSILRLGDVLVVQTGDIGQVAHVTEDFVGCNCHALIICRPDTEMIIGEYLSWVYCSDYGQQFLHLVKTGALHPHLNCGNVKFFPVIVPPLEEQKAIAENLTSSIEKHRDIESRISESIRGLQEYRSALITAAVTGQLEIT